ncbi:MAG: hypothetical protein IM574_07750 [Cytophagales bacterium]|nr:hypothetical protein [Cytophagales bacterium]MCA6386358.1 hypothetical protein [Cytophagales bacterium]MCA6390471.1 hypothetical protein [Cytophagales bacterium]MCA6395049.1 hypothetical protein [Cytophagales bacterium]MCA6397959.1 hypothetical protein [Cytophagales bacterium]
MSEGINQIHQRVAAFKRKYYANLFLKGSLLTLTFVLGYFLIAALLEYNLWLGREARFLIFASFFGLVAFCLFQFLKEPLTWWLYKKGLGEEDSAKLIGNYFPTIGDRLLNVLQLSEKNAGALAEAGIFQKANTFKDISFESAIDFKTNTKYLKYLAAPVALCVLLLVIDRGIFTQSTQRIVQFNQEFSPQAPFSFSVEKESLTAFFNEDFTLRLSIEGSAIPETAYIVSGSQRWRMESLGTGKFSYLFEKVQSEIDLQFEASGFFSSPYKIQLINRPELIKINVELLFPRYLGKTPERLTNVGNLEIPEGTKVSWLVGTSSTSKATLAFASSGIENDMRLVDNQSFQFSKNMKDPDQYTIVLENEKSKNKDQISYSINTIKDQRPEIVVDNLRDSILFKSIMLGGALSDDYGITELRLNYEIVKGSRSQTPKTILIPLVSTKNQQNFFYRWPVDSLQLQPGDKLTYHLQVWDNDGVNGRKSTRSSDYIFSLPGEEELKAEVSKSQQAAQNKIDQSLQKAKDLKRSIDEAQEKLKGKQALDWQDKKMLEDLVEQKQKLDQAIKDLQKENSLLEQKKESFSEESERIKEKSEQIQKLMNELLDDETKKLFEELEKLLKQNADPSQMQKLLDKMERKEINMEKELERTLELFKQLQYDYKLEQAIDDLKQQKEKQEQLLERTQELSGEKKEPEKNNAGKDDKSGEEKGNKNEKGKEGSENEKPDAQGLAQEQEELKKETEKFEKTIDELEKMGEELEESQDTPSDQDTEELKKSQEESKESLEQGKPKKSAEQQKKSIDKMKQMQQKLEGMQSSMEMEMDMANLESLRQILHGLIKLSFDQESVMKDFNQVQQTDPKYIQLSQNQLKIKDDAKVLEDSLLALSKKDPFMGSVVTKEVGELNDHLDKASVNVKERRKPNASSEMQFSMTSINNLALMLNDHFDMMMDMMANAKPGSGKGKGKKKGGQPNLGKLQQQLNQQMQEIKNGGKSGRQLSEEFARMAAEQERIRRALQEMQEKMKKEGGKIPGGDIPGKMEQTEMDLVNKQITEQTIRRQNEIITRLLEAEKSMREQNQEEERKGETAKDYSQEMPRAFEEYLRLKEKELELLKTVPPKLFPYYKKEVNEYFKRMGTKE